MTSRLLTRGPRVSGQQGHHSKHLGLVSGSRTARRRHFLPAPAANRFETPVGTHFVLKKSAQGSLVLGGDGSSIFSIIY